MPLYPKPLFYYKKPEKVITWLNGRPGKMKSWLSSRISEFYYHFLWIKQLSLKKKPLTRQRCWHLQKIKKIDSFPNPLLPFSFLLCAKSTGVWFLFFPPPPPPPLKTAAPLPPPHDVPPFLWHFFGFFLFLLLIPESMTILQHKKKIRNYLHV